MSWLLRHLLHPFNSLTLISLARILVVQIGNPTNFTDIARSMATLLGHTFHPRWVGRSDVEIIPIRLGVNPWPASAHARHGRRRRVRAVEVADGRTKSAHDGEGGMGQCHGGLV